MNTIFTTYFTSGDDPQRVGAWASNDYSIIKDFYESLIKHNLNCVIIHDNCSPEFIEQYSTDKIKFVRVNEVKLNTVDYRWKLYHNLLEEMKEIKNLYCLDISDVVILRNPFLQMNKKMVYIGSEGCLNYNNFWMMQRYISIKHTEVTGYMQELLDKQVLNCGIMGGNRTMMLDILKRMGDILEQSNVTETTVDMVVANAVIYKYYGDKFITGLPLNTKYRGGAFPYRGENNDADKAWIQHK